MKKIFLPLVFLLSLALQAQQVADTLFEAPVKNPVYLQNQGPLVLIDEAHQNFHTRDGRFKPFAKLLQKDGYVVKSSNKIFTKEILSAAKIMVIVNALHPDNLDRWTLPTPSAFTDEEITSLNEWVKQGGALLLIADHMPFPGAAEKLAASFGIKFFNGFAMKKRGGGNDIFALENGLQENLITNGRSAEEKITSLQTFTGQAFKIPESAHSIILLPDDYEMKLPETAWQFNTLTPTLSADKLSQGAYFTYGEGRVVVFGEAAMFTAQQAGRKNKFGMNAPTASQNAQFILNTIHWLDKILN